MRRRQRQEEIQEAAYTREPEESSPEPEAREAIEVVDLDEEEEAPKKDEKEEEDDDLEVFDL